MKGRNRLALFVGIGCILAAIASAQQPDTVLYFPDSMGYCYNPTAILHNPVTGRVYVANSGGDGGVLVFDPATRRKEKFYRGFYSRGIYCPDIGKLYLASGQVLTIVDASADTVLGAFEIEVGDPYLVYNRRLAKLYAFSDDGGLAIIDATADTVISYNDIHAWPVGGVWDSVGNRLYIAGERGFVDVFDGEADSLVGEVFVSSDNLLAGLALNPSRRRLYISTQVDTVYAIDADSLRVATVLGGLSGPLACNPVLDRLYGSRADSVAVVDCANDSVTALVPVGDFVRGISVNRAGGQVYVSAYNQERLAVIDAGDTIARTIALDTVGTPEVLEYAEERDELYCPMQADNVAIIDGTADTLSGVMRYPQYIVRGLAHATVGNKLYLLLPERDTVLVLDRDYRQVGAIPVPMLSSGIFTVYNPGLNRLYVADDGWLWVIDCTGDSLLSGHPLDSLGRANTAVVVQPLGKLYVFPRDAPFRAYVYDCLRDSVVAQIQLPARATSAAYHPWTNQVYASVSGDYTVFVFDPVGDTIVKTLRAGRPSSYNEMLANTINGMLYQVSNSSTERLYTIDVRSNVLVDSIDLPDDGDTIFWYQPADKLYLCDRSTSPGITVFDCNTGEILRSLPVACGFAGALDEASERLYLGGDGYVSVLDCRNDSVVATYPIPDAPRFSFVNPIDNRVYFAERSNWVAVFQDQLAVEEGSSQEPAVLFRAVSNPVRGRAWFQCQVPVGQTAEFSAYDAAGRLARRLEVAGRNGVSSFAWDRADQGGQRVANGVYFCRFETPERCTVVKVVLE